MSGDAPAPTGPPALRPFPLRGLAERLLREVDAGGPIYDLPRDRVFTGTPGRDLSVRFHGRPAATPLGPAAGPHSQMAQNLVLAWLAGCRILELKTVQVLDRLEIPRPCIDMRTIGFNVEWSQELTLEESRREYVKAALLVEGLKAEGGLGLPADLTPTVWDLSVGYDLAGLQSDTVGAFLRGMTDVRATVEELRPELPRRWRDLELPARLAGTLTLSTFHGCPPDEIERMLDWLMRTHRLDVVVKLNPMLLGPGEARRLLHDVLGYDDVHVPDSAFERDTKWDRMEGFVERLAATAAELGVGFGVKFSNTLIVENRGDFLPAGTRESYLSGQPLHVLAIRLVERFRERFGTRIPVSFSAGIDRANFADAVALGLVPVTVCTDLLRPGGYGRARGYLDALAARMVAVGAHTIDEWIVRAYGHAAAALEAATEGVAEGGAVRAAAEAALADGADLRAAVGDAVWSRWVDEAKLRNTPDYVARATTDPRYAKARNAKPPKKVGTRLELLDCLTCDKCLPVCPNDANFRVEIGNEPFPVERLVPVEGGDAAAAGGGGEAGEEAAAGSRLHVERGEPWPVEKRHQIANFVDFCNECGNCDVFCPEDGGPYILKPRFHGSLEAYEADAPADAMWIGRGRVVPSVGPGVAGRSATGPAPPEAAFEARGRFRGVEVRLVREGGGAPVRYAGPGFDLTLDLARPAEATGPADDEVELVWAHVLDRYGRALLAEGAPNWVRTAGEGTTV